MAKKNRKPTGRQKAETPQGGPPTPKPLSAPPGGPYLQMAFFCEKILTEADGVTSFIRQVDRLTTAASGPGAPAKMPTTNFTAFMAIVLKSGAAQGSAEVKLFRERPSGLRDADPLFTVTVFLEGAERGVGLYGPVNMTFEEAGLYWFDLYADETLMTRMPIRVIYQRATAGSA